jgi:hypothetical protein
MYHHGRIEDVKNELDKREDIQIGYKRQREGIYQTEEKSGPNQNIEWNCRIKERIADGMELKEYGDAEESRHND